MWPPAPTPRTRGGARIIRRSPALDQRVPAAACAAILARNVAIHIAAPSSEADWRIARLLVDEYARSLRVDLSFQNFSHERQHLATEYGPPDGAFLLARDGDAPCGCVGLRRFASDAAELKRLYVVPAARGRGLGRELATRMVAIARAIGYARLLLDTLPTMGDARALYESLGFRVTTPYRVNPIPGSAFLALPLSQGQPDR